MANTKKTSAQTTKQSTTKNQQQNQLKMLFNQ